MKKLIIATLVTGFLLALTAQFATAATLISEKNALKQMFPDTDKVEKVTHTLTDAEYKTISKRLGGMTLLQKGSKSDKVANKREYTFYFGYKGDKKTAVAIFEEQPGKWGPVEFIVALDVETAKVKDLAVTALQEKRGKPIARRNFLDRFVGKDSSDPIEVRDDIKSIAGATISCKCAAFVVRKVIALYEEVYLSNSATPKPVVKKKVKPLLERLQECDTEIRAKAFAEFTKLEQAEKDKLTQQLMDALGGKETTDCQREGIDFALRSASHSKIIEKLQGVKVDDKVKLGKNFEGALAKIAELGKVKLTWANESLQKSAKTINLEEAYEVDGEENAYELLENVMESFGCVNGRASEKEDKAPCYTYLVEADGIKITDLTSATKYWQEWWKSKNEKEAKKD